VKGVERNAPNPHTPSGRRAEKHTQYGRVRRTVATGPYATGHEPGAEQQTATRTPGSDAPRRLPLAGPNGRTRDSPEFSTKWRARPTASRTRRPASSRPPQRTAARQSPRIRSTRRAEHRCIQPAPGSAAKAARKKTRRASRRTEQSPRRAAHPAHRRQAHRDSGDGTPERRQRLARAETHDSKPAQSLPAPQTDQHPLSPTPAERTAPRGDRLDAGQCAHSVPAPVAQPVVVERTGPRKTTLGRQTTASSRQPQQTRGGESPPHKKNARSGNQTRGSSV